MATCNLNVIVVPEFISRGLYLLFAILLSSKFQNSIFYQHMRPESGLKFSRSTGSREDFFCDFYHIWAWRPSWSCDLDHLYKLSFPLPKDAPHEVWL